MNDKSNIRVLIRVRPRQPHEDGSTTNALQVDQDSNIITLSAQNDSQTRNFAFDSVLDETSAQEDVHSALGLNKLVQSVLSGYHGTVFAYGQTGTGKTYTMEGFEYSTGDGGPKARTTGSSRRAQGVVPTAVKLLYQTINPSQKLNINCSFVQIYREQVYDLLSPAFSAADIKSGKAQQSSFAKDVGKPGGTTGAALKMRWTKHDGFFLDNLKMVECGSAEEALQQFKLGVKNKIMASHRMNMASSRSHSVFTLHVTSASAGPPSGTDAASIASKMTLVDLAGSERAALTGGGSAELMQESIFINKSLFTLRKVIMALAENRYKGLHIPYRDSKLTSLLQHSLGGNSLTVMIACVSPCDMNYEENLSTLEYASRAKNITNTVFVNEDPKTRLIKQLKAENAFLKEQLSKQAQLFGMPGAAVDRLVAERGPGGHSPPRARTDPSHRDPASAGRGDAAAGRGAPGPPGPSKAWDAPAASPGASPKAAKGAAGGPQSAGVVEAGANRAIEMIQEAQTAAHAARKHVGGGAGGGGDGGAGHLEVIGQKLVESVKYVKEVSGLNQELRINQIRLERTVDELGAENERLAFETHDMQDRIDLYESILAQDADAPTPRSSGGGQDGPKTKRGDKGEGVRGAVELHTADMSVRLELLELRREADSLRDRLARWEHADGTPLPVAAAIAAASGQASRGQGSTTRRTPGAKPAPRGPPAATASRGMLSVNQLKQVVGGGRGGAGGGRGGAAGSTGADAGPSVLLTTTGGFTDTAAIQVMRPSTAAGLPHPADGDVSLDSSADLDPAAQLTNLMRTRNALTRSHVPST